MAGCFLHGHGAIGYPDSLAMDQTSLFRCVSPGGYPGYCLRQGAEAVRLDRFVLGALLFTSSFPPVNHHYLLSREVPTSATYYNTIKRPTLTLQNGPKVSKPDL
jgi:hypothetical protein